MTSKPSLRRLQIVRDRAEARRDTAWARLQAGRPVTTWEALQVDYKVACDAADRANAAVCSALGISWDVEMDAAQATR